MPRKKQTQPIEQLSLEQVDYVLNFARTLSTYYPNIFNPYLSNQYLKNINMNPLSSKRDDVEKMLDDPKNNEKNLRGLSQHFDNVQMPYKRLKYYYASILTFDYTIWPFNADEKDIKSNTYKREEEKVYNWLDKFNIKRELGKVNRKLILEDAEFTVLRESDNAFTLQELPIDWSMITAKWEYGYLFDFNMQYFNQFGVDINEFPPIFKKFWRNVMDIKKNNNKKYYPNIRYELRNGQYAYWVQCNPNDGFWCFKFNTEQAGQVPLLAPLFVDNIELDNYKKLQSNKNMIEAYNLLVGMIPRNKDNRSGTRTDDFAISAEAAAKFSQLINNALPEGIRMSVVPFEDVKQFSFEKSSSSDIVRNALQQYYNASGTSQFLFNSEKTNAIAIQASIKTDEYFINHLYTQYQDYLNYQLSKMTKKFKFRVKLEGTMFDRDKRIENAFKYAEKGIVLPELGSALGLEPKEFEQKLMVMRAKGFVEKLTPLPSSHTQSSKDGGRPELSDDKKSDNGIITKDSGSNVGKNDEV